MIRFLSNYLTLRTKILTGFALIILVVAAIWFALFSNISGGTLKDEIGKYFQVLTNESYNHIEKEIEFRLSQVEIYSLILSDDPQLQASNETFAELEGREAYIQQYDEIWKANSESEVVKEVLQSPLSEKIKRNFVLDEYYSDHDHPHVFAEAIVTNRYGATIAASQLTTDYNQADERWWQAARDEGSYIGPLRYDTSVDGYVVDVAAAIQNVDGDFVGVFRVGLAMESVFSTVTKLNDDIRASLNTEGVRLESLRLSLIDTQDRTIYSSDEDMEPFTPFPEELLSGVRDDKDVLTTLQYGEQLVVASDHVSDDNLDWTLVLSAQLEDVYTPIGEMRFQLVIAILILVTISLLLGGWYASTLIYPITSLTQIVNEIAKGNFNKEMPAELTQRGDEIGVLANSFEDMTDDLYNLYTELDTKVKDRTDALEKAKAQAEREKVQDEAILLSIGEGLVVTNKNGQIEFVNKAFSEQLGWARGAVRGKQLSEVIPTFDAETEESVPQEEQILAKVLKAKNAKGLQEVFYFERKDGSRFPVSVTVSPILHKGETIGAVEVFRDITHEMAVDKAKTEFVSLASHQLRTPLSTINWYAEMLLSGDAGKLKDEQRSYLEEIYTGNQRMVTLVNALLNVSRIELGTLSVEPVPTDVVALAKEVIQEQKPLAEEKKLTVTTDFDDFEEVNLDPNLLHIVYQNLLSNSIKYTPEEGEVTFAVKDKGSSFLIQVEDTGMGIPDYQQDEIFTKLFRADNVKEQETTGTGLGLYMVKKIVDQARGKIWFESVQDEGTTFYVTLPKTGMSQKLGSKKLESNS